jgi:hypothetical protein
MAVVRIHRYGVDPADLEDRTFTDIWRWDSAEQMQATPAMPIPEAGLAMSLTRDATAVNGEVVDER